MEDITGAENKNEFVKILKKKGQYHNFYLKSDTLHLTDVFENFRKVCFTIHHLDPVKFLSVPGLA